MDISNELAAVGAILGALGAILPQVIPWLTERSNLGRESKRIDIAKKEIEFISTWMEAAADFSGPEIEDKKRQAESQLASLLVPPSTALSHPESGLESIKGKPSILSNIAFYGYLGFYLFLVFGASIEDGTNDSSLEELSKNFGMIITFLVPLVILFFVRRRSQQKNAEAINLN